jgi:uncharacterized protein YkwD
MTGTVRRGVVLAVVAAVVLTISGCTRNAEAWQSYQLVNQERAARGLPQLQLNKELVDKAHAWARTMASSGVRHSNLTAGIGDWWTVLGENVASAGSVAEAHRMFLNSAVHRGVMTDRRMTKVGTGVAVAGGRVYVVQVYAG